MVDPWSGRGTRHGRSGRFPESGGVVVSILPTVAALLAQTDQHAILRGLQKGFQERQRSGSLTKSGPTDMHLMR